MLAVLPQDGQYQRGWVEEAQPGRHGERKRQKKKAAHRPTCMELYFVACTARYMVLDARERAAERERKRAKREGGNEKETKKTARGRAAGRAAGREEEEGRARGKQEGRGTRRGSSREQSAHSRAARTTIEMLILVILISNARHTTTEENPLLFSRARPPREA